MKLPLLKNDRTYLRKYLVGENPVSDVVYEGTGKKIKKNFLKELMEEIRGVAGELGDISSGPGGRKFDQQVASVMHSKLGINARDAGHAKFWSYISLILSPDLIERRFPAKKDDGDTPDNRYLGGNWKNTFERLWWRAEVAIDRKNTDDPYHLVRRGGDDFWVGIIERKISANRHLVRELVKKIYPEESDTTDYKYREILKRIRKMWPSYALESISRDKIRDYIDYAVNNT